MKKLCVFISFSILIFCAQSVFSQNSKEAFNIDWNNDLEASIFYNDIVLNSFTQNLRRYGYYHIDYGVRNDLFNYWRNEVKYETFVNPNYYRIMLSFNYFYIEYLFSDSQLKAGKNSFFAGTSFRRCNYRTFAQDVNEVVDKIYLHIVNLLKKDQDKMIKMTKEEQIRFGEKFGVDVGWLVGTRGNLKMRVN